MDREEAINSIIETITSLADLEEVYLFGSSLDSSKLHQYSDIDMLLVGNTDKPKYKLLGNLRRNIHVHYPIDFVLYSPEEFAKWCNFLDYPD